MTELNRYYGVRTSASDNKSSIHLLKGDCMKLMWAIKSESVNLVICDLPYGVTEAEWDNELPFDELWNHWERVLVPNGTVVLFTNGRFTAKAMGSNMGLYKYRWCWIKTNSTNFIQCKNRPMCKSEDILVFSKGSVGHKSQLGDKRMTYNPQGLIPHEKRVNPHNNITGTVVGKRPSQRDEHETYIRKFTNYPTDVLTGYSELPPGQKSHPNEKPIPLLEFLIKTYTNDGDMVLDNCMGSGTAGIACLNSNRRFVGIEIDDKYYEIAKERVADAVRKEE